MRVRKYSFFRDVRGFVNSDTNDSYVLYGGGVVTHPPLLQNEALLN